ncbi:STOREKEEPER protein-like [Lolium rigidum]|uniref:STOREKEEPER protein-like n=1 Tax=Lolium rigidum TaxID=89674 RepID=UPI001F5DE799|nr:STOREKEEPER protein-like [Lolium rigidum]
MAPKRPAAAAAAASGSASDASDAEADAPHHHNHPPSDTDPSKTPPPNPNPKSSSAAAAAAAPSAPADSAPARSDSGGSYSDSSAAARRRRPAPRPAAPSPKPRPRSPGINSDSYDSHAAAGFDTDLDPAAGADSDSDSHNTPSPPRPSARHNPRAEAAIVKPISSRPMDPPRRGGAKRPRSAAVPAPPPPPSSEKRPARLWSPDDELVILRGLATYRAKSGVLPGSTNDIGKLHGHIRAHLSVKVSTTQLSDKVRRLKQKYQLLATRAKNGRDQELHTPHDRSIYEHAKKVWGTRTGSTAGDDYDIAAGDGDSEELPATENSDDDDDGMDSGRDDRYRIKNRKLMPIAMANGHSIQRRPALPPPNSRTKTDFEKGKDAYPYLWETVEELAREHPSGAAFKKAFEVLEGSKAQVMEEKLRKFRLTEIRQQLRRMDLMKDTVRMVLDALERAD